MATDPTPPQDPKDPPKDPTQDDPEGHFFGKLSDLIDARLDAAFEKRKKDFLGTGTSRTGGRSTFAGALADLMFGKQPEK